MQNRCNVILGGLERGASTALSANVAAYHVLIARIMYDTDRTGHAPHSILRRTACVHRSRDTVRCVAQFVLVLVDGI